MDKNKWTEPPQDMIARVSRRRGFMAYCTHGLFTVPSATALVFILLSLWLEGYPGGPSYEQKLFWLFIWVLVHAGLYLGCYPSREVPHEDAWVERNETLQTALKRIRVFHEHPDATIKQDIYSVVQITEGEFADYTPEFEALEKEWIHYPEASAAATIMLGRASRAIAH